MGEKNLADSLLNFLLGFMVGMVLIWAITNVGVARTEKSTRIASLETIEEANLHVMMSEYVSMKVIQFATNEGYIIYYDGALYSEYNPRD